MHPLHRALITVCLLGCGSVMAQSLRCNGQIASVGESRLSFVQKCGEPMLKDSYCAPVYYHPNLQPVPSIWIGTVLPCQPVDEWLYDRGPGNLSATVRFKGGVVDSIHYGHTTR
ncbi:DUF2845 domain-containing protein [Caldimonas brevitalea]|uniref:DUF2845 domain-containing protein n=1 Tax=Caldimonas brevitalea TaxID=413882 RepID=A0A0G3BFL3_9BURK|nr:DUF2845 domain-containing protein [Caldimonas brevitalea]AKJ28234.1 hypothetical protein AAW51_1543 [Caldimonas brevitalea]